MYKLSILMLALAITFAIDPSMVQVSTQKLDELSSSNLGKMIMEMAQAHAEMRGPLEDLVAAISDLETELTNELQQLEDDYTRSTNQHANTQQNLDVQIGDTEINIFNETDFIDAVLVPSIDQTNQKIDRISGYMKDNRDNLARETLNRQKEHQQFLDRISEHSSAISAVDEAIQLINALINGNLSFAEKGSIHAAFDRINTKTQKTDIVHPIVEALLALAQNFSDQEQAKKIRDLLQDTRNQLVSSMNQETADEKNIEQTWADRQATLNKEYEEFKRSVLEATYVLAAQQSKLKSTKEALAENQQDLQNFKDSLQQDKDVQAQETQIYNELKSQYQVQLQTTRNAKEFINSAEFSNVMRQKISSKGLI